MLNEVGIAKPLLGWAFEIATTPDLKERLLNVVAEHNKLSAVGVGIESLV